MENWPDWQKLLFGFGALVLLVVGGAILYYGLSHIDFRGPK